MAGAPLTESAAPGDATIRAFRDCVGEFATGVTVLTSEHEGKPAGLTINSFTSVSLEPLLVLVSLGLGSRTLRTVRASGRFALSILARGQRDVALDFAEHDIPFPAAHVERVDGMLAVRGAIASLRCSVREMLRAGDHDLVLGEILGFRHDGGEPLVFHRGRFGGVVADSIVPSGHPIAASEGAGW
jgi:flavin reductase (DIM6/NTAB) family NADH-FMN oxidoreductase RutF